MKVVAHEWVTYFVTFNIDRWLYVGFHVHVVSLEGTLGLECLFV